MFLDTYERIREKEKKGMETSSVDTTDNEANTTSKHRKRPIKYSFLTLLYFCTSL